jgi:cyanophycinase
VSAGRLLLVGSGEFTPAMADIDREILASFGTTTPRVAIVPTAAGLEDTPKSWIEMGTAHFRALGAEPIPVMVLNRDDAHEPRWSGAIESADWIYFSGGHPGHLVESLVGTPFWSAVLARVRAGAVLAGSSAGAMMLGSTTILPLGFDARGMPTGITFRPGLGLLPGVFVAPHFDAVPENVWLSWADNWPDGHRMLGIDEDTALLQRAGDWTVLGRGRVLAFQSPTAREEHRTGAVLNGLAVSM